MTSWSVFLNPTKRYHAAQPGRVEIATLDLGSHPGVPL